ncbi:hypothetical protein [Aromatoleum diolicum]|uniref:Uncharacterized protein n=1 Tax=Aromatoleum diolicum TaxID=75796 RepID=A0ABX1QC45_9RHOO|nr:hypothetical protein [Aromatoleum diolicum]NMG75600.1 hypothetical protein [Aromatoleum diolicum]
MSATGYPKYDTPLTTEERRRLAVDPAATPHRRINDTYFNRIRWPAAVYAWFVLGGAMFAYLLFWVFEG